MIEIIDERANKRLTYEDLCSGDIFEYKNNFYMKTNIETLEQKFGNTKETGNYAAINLKLGEAVEIETKEYVTLINKVKILFD